MTNVKDFGAVGDGRPDDNLLGHGTASAVHVAEGSATVDANVVVD